jgi:hypothetical protein
VSTFTTCEEAEDELAAVLEDEPAWADDRWAEPVNRLETTTAEASLERGMARPVTIGDYHSCSP